MTHIRREFTEATKRQALERSAGPDGQPRCQDPLCGVSDEWKALWRELMGETAPAWEFPLRKADLVSMRDSLLRLAKSQPKRLNPIIKRFQLDASPLLEIDHEREDADGGDNTLANAVVRCVFCHAFKTQVRGNTRRKAPKKQLSARSGKPTRVPEQMDVLKTAKVEGVRIQMENKLAAAKVIKDMQAQMVGLPEFKALAKRQERRHYTDAQVTEAAQRRERAILDNDGFWGA